jgi:hypothetical protein
LSKLPFTPKLRRFAQNGVVLGILGFSFFFFLKKKEGNKKKRRKKSGWLRPPHTGRMGVAEATPGLCGWSGHPERPKKKKKRKNGFWPLGVAGPPPKAWGGFGHPHTAGMGWPKPPPGPRGWAGHPKGQNPFFRFFFFFLAFRGGRTTPKGLGWLRPPSYGRYGVAEATLWPKMEWSDHPIFWARGGSSHPDFFLFFNFFFILFFISFFFSKKKKILKFVKT